MCVVYAFHWRWKVVAYGILYTWLFDWHTYIFKKWFYKSNCNAVMVVVYRLCWYNTGKLETPYINWLFIALSISWQTSSSEASGAKVPMLYMLLPLDGMVNSIWLARWFSRLLPVAMITLYRSRQSYFSVAQKYCFTDDFILDGFTMVSHTGY